MAFFFVFFFFFFVFFLVASTCSPVGSSFAGDESEA